MNNIVYVKEIGIINFKFISRVDIIKESDTYFLSFGDKEHYTLFTYPNEPKQKDNFISRTKAEEFLYDIYKQTNRSI